MFSGSEDQELMCTQAAQAPVDCLLHAGGALADGLVASQSLAGMRTVFAAKVSPQWALV